MIFPAARTQEFGGEVLGREYFGLSPSEWHLEGLRDRLFLHRFEGWNELYEPIFDQYAFSHRMVSHILQVAIDRFQRDQTSLANSNGSDRNEDINVVSVVRLKVIDCRDSTTDCILADNAVSLHPVDYLDHSLHLIIGTKPAHVLLRHQRFNLSRILWHFMRQHPSALL